MTLLQPTAAGGRKMKENTVVVRPYERPNRKLRHEEVRCSHPRTPNASL